MIEIKCNGENCTAINGRGHSQECINNCNSAHDRTNTTNSLDSAGSRHRTFWYSGYKNRPIDDNHTADQIEAWEEGQRARLRKG